jgi:cell division septation protein DedD
MAAPEPPAPIEPAPRWTVEIASFGDAGRAGHLSRRLRARFPEAHVSPLAASAQTYYRVRIGPYGAREAAATRAALVTRLGYPAVITEIAEP